MANNTREYHAVAENELLRRHRHVLTNLAHLVAQPLRLSDFMHEAALRVSQAVEIDHVKVLRFRPQHGDLFAEAGVGWNPGVVGSVAFPSDMASPPGRAFRTAQPVIIEDLKAADDFRPSPTLKEHGIVSLMNVPILVDGTAWGVLEVDSPDLGRFSPDTLGCMTAAAALLAAAVRRCEAEAAQRAAVAAGAVEAQKHALLLREVQHRVKNNFQTVLAMIALRRPRFTSEKGRQLADELTNAVMAMSLAHDLLSQDGDDQVSLAAYLKALVSTIQDAHPGITMDVEANEMEAGIDHAVPLGLIVNEAVTNAAKHAFPSGEGRVRIELLNSGAGEALLSVCDDGIGMKDAKPGGSGLRLLEALARQLGGRVERESGERGTLIRAVFPRPARAGGAYARR